MMNYNKALDYTVLALNEMRNGKSVLAARLFAKAAEQSDLTAAIRILEASNATAYKAMVAAKSVKQEPAAKSRLQAAADGEVDTPEEPEVDMGDMDGDPLEQVADFEGEEASEDDTAPAEDAIADEPVSDSPAMAVAKVLSSMNRKAK
jgi:hypothetical protein